MAGRRREEDGIQRAVFQHINARAAPGVFAFHVPNGGKRSAIEASIFKGLGVVAGVPDVIAFRPVELIEGRAAAARGSSEWKGCKAYALEIKTEDGKVSTAQLETIRAMQTAGVTVAVVYGLDAALAKLEEWGVLRGRAE